jgi:hypothetical protein
MQRYRDRLPVLAAALLVAATILFVVGTTIERSQARTDQHQQTNPVEQPPGGAGETTEQHQGEATNGEANTTTEGTQEHHSTGESGEQLLGINPEGAGLTAAVAAVSLLLARPRKGLLVAVVLVGLLFATLDGREVIHQASESNAGLLVLALVTGLLHLGVAVAAAAGLRAPRAVAVTS